MPAAGAARQDGVYGKYAIKENGKGGILDAIGDDKSGKRESLREMLRAFKRKAPVNQNYDLLIDSGFRNLNAFKVSGYQLTSESSLRSHEFSSAALRRQPKLFNSNEKLSEKVDFYNFIKTARI